MKPNEIFNFKGSKENKFILIFNQFMMIFIIKSLESKIINYKELLLNLIPIEKNFKK